MSKHKSNSSPASSGDPRLVKAAKKRNGSTIIRGKVNQKIAEAATAETLRVSPEDVKVDIFDDNGKMGLDISTVMRHDDVMRCTLLPELSLQKMVGQARGNIVQKFAKAAGVEVGKVNILLSGVKKSQKRGG